MATMYFGYYFGKLSIATTDGSKPEKGDWQEIDPTTLSDNQQEMYEAYKAAYRIAKEAKAAFEASVRREAGFAVKPVTKTTKKPGLSLADYLAMQQ
jgi:hypothetical protein